MDDVDENVASDYDDVVELDVDRENSGIQPEFPVENDDAPEMDYFLAFFDSEVMEVICEQSDF